MNWRWVWVEVGGWAEDGLEIGDVEVDGKMMVVVVVVVVGSGIVVT